MQLLSTLLYMYGKGIFSSQPLFVSVPPTEFSRESLLEAAGGLECPPLSKDEEDCSSFANVADPSSQQNNAQPGRVKSAPFTQESFPSGDSSSCVH